MSSLLLKQIALEKRWVYGHVQEGTTIMLASSTFSMLTLTFQILIQLISVALHPNPKFFLNVEIKSVECNVNANAITSKCQTFTNTTRICKKYINN
jgi:hypothetical protein